MKRADMHRTATRDVKTVRDNRGKNWFWADHAIIDVYGPLLGAYPIAAYMVLARHVDDSTQECWPSYDTIAYKLKVSRPSAIHFIDDLEDCGLVHVQEYKIDDKYQLTNIFTLLPREEWKDPETVQLRSAALKEKKRATRNGSGMGKHGLPPEQHGSPGGIHRQSHGLPEVHTENKKQIKKKQHNSNVAPDASLVAEMLHIGVSVPVAEELSRDYAPEGIRAQLQYLAARNPKDAAATLVASIRGAWAPPANSADNHTNGATSTPRIDAAKLDAAIAREETTVYEALAAGERAEVDKEVDRGESFSAVMQRRYNIRARATDIVARALKSGK